MYWEHLYHKLQCIQGGKKRWKVSLRAWKATHSVGYDDIPECIVKQYIQLDKKPLTHICNVSLNSGVFHNESKIGKVKPLHKKGDSYDNQNHRPISVLPIFFPKLLERFMFNNLKHFF